MRRAAALLALGLLALLGAARGADAGRAAPDLFREHCASCHGAARLGGIGPALLPENLARLKKPAAAAMIRASRPGVQMPPFGAKLSAGEIDRLVAYIYTPIVPAPAWGADAIRASRIVQHAPGSLPDKPAFAADPLNLFVIVEGGDHHVTILDGDRLEPLGRFPTRFALHGGPKFTPDGRYVYFGSRDGWISKFDLWNLATVAEVRAGINMRNIAISSDGRHVIAANYLPHTLVVLDADLGLERVIDARGDSGKSSRVSAVYDAAPRSAFVAALKDVPELWEIPYRAGRDFLRVRRVALDEELDDFFFTPDYRQVVGAQRGGRAQAVDLDSGRAVATLALAGLPHLGSGISWVRDGRRVVATPNLRAGVVTVIDVDDWKVVKEIPTLGPGFFLRSHGNTPYAWVDSMMSPTGRDTLQVIDKERLEVVARLTPEKGRTLAHIEFDRYGRYALASLSEMDGAIIVFDARTLKEVKRIPACKPIGKYNVYNKITRDDGTSH